MAGLGSDEISRELTRITWFSVTYEKIAFSCMIMTIAAQHGTIFQMVNSIKYLHCITHHDVTVRRSAGRR